MTSSWRPVGATTSVVSFNAPPPPPIILSAAQIQANYGTALNVLPPTPSVAPTPQEVPPQQDQQQEESQEEDSEEESDAEAEETSEEVMEEEGSLEGEEQLAEEEESTEEEIARAEEVAIKNKTKSLIRAPATNNIDKTVASNTAVAPKSVSINSNRDAKPNTIIGLRKPTNPSLNCLFLLTKYPAT